MKLQLSHILLVKEYIDANLATALTIEEIAGNFAINSFTLRRQFKKQYHLSIKHYIYSARMHRGKELLSSRNYSIKEVSCKVGYSEVSAFSRAFTEFFGFPPSKFNVGA